MITAALTATGSMSLLVSAFEKNQVRAIVVISLIGAVLPVCGVSVLPLVAGLLGAGVPLAPVMAFLLSSPVTDTQMLAITISTLGWNFAVGKTLSAMAIGIVGGGFTLAIVRVGMFSRRRPQFIFAGSFNAEITMLGIRFFALEVLAISGANGDFSFYLLEND